MPDDSPNRLLQEKLIEVISEARLQQMQREPTRGQNLLDLFCCNKPSLVKACISIPGISDHSIVLADCDLKATINKKPPRKVFIEYMEGILAVNIPSKLLNSWHNLPWINRNLKTQKER